MKKLVAAVLLVTSLSVSTLPAYSQNPPGQSNDNSGSDTHLGTLPPEGGSGVGLGVVAVAVSLLGLIALAASSGGGEATPATTVTHQAN